MYLFPIQAVFRRVQDGGRMQTQGVAPVLERDRISISIGTFGWSVPRATDWITLTYYVSGKNNSYIQNVSIICQCSVKNINVGIYLVGLTLDKFTSIIWLRLFIRPRFRLGLWRSTGAITRERLGGSIPTLHTIFAIYPPSGHDETLLGWGYNHT